MTRAYRAILVGILSLATGLALGHGASAQQAPRKLEVTLSAAKIAADPDGTERRVSADEARPGDVVEYTVACVSLSDAVLENVRPVVPIPAGMELVLDSPSPAAYEASLDGASFAPAPLRRKTTGPDGSPREEPVPAREYRAVRWRVPVLDPGARWEGRARVRVLRDEAAAPR